MDSKGVVLTYVVYSNLCPWSTVMPLYLFDVLGSNRSKSKTKVSVISIKCSYKKFSVKILTADLTADKDQSTQHM